MPSRKRGKPGAAAAALVALCLLAPGASRAEPAADPSSQDRQWIQQMKRDPRGPFSAIRWFCADGAEVDPAAGNCAEHGGGVQHGQWSERTRDLRSRGYLIGSLLVALDPATASQPLADPAALPQILVERFLVGYDDGWIFRGGRGYRGAFQNEDEREAGRRLLLTLLAGDAPFLAVREAARLLPHAAETPLFVRVRELSTQLDSRDPPFNRLRARIHNWPQADDARRVREAAARADPALRGDYEALALAIEEAFGPPSLAEAVAGLARQIRDPRLRGGLQAAAGPAVGREDPAVRLLAAARVMIWLREHLDEMASPALQLAALDLSLGVESSLIVATSELQAGLGALSRHARLQHLDTIGGALYGAGLLSARERRALGRTVDALPAGPVMLVDYRERLEALARVPQWATRRIDHALGDGIDRLAAIEPLAELYVPDRLRGSPLLFYSRVLQSLRDDAERVAQVRSSLFGASVAGGLRRLNAGLARGVLRTALDAGGEPAIYLVPETTSALPAAAGILTAEEGNPLSHVQLLARNLGIPNVVVARELLAEVATRRDRRIVVAATPGGLVQIADDGSEWDRALGVGATQAPATIALGLGKLDLRRTDVVSTADLGAADSGRSVGPKAAQVGELTRRFPGMVAPGLVLPFGVYREFMSQPVRPRGPPMLGWMADQYAQLAVQRRLDPMGHAERVRTFLSFVRQWIAQQPLDAGLRERLADAMQDRFGAPGTYGVFVRSDTNVEDVPGFTGAGLNLTVPNVVGVDEVLRAMRAVWASPFGERAFGWRQERMEQPEHLYVSVLLHRSVPSEKSGVMVTADPDSGDAGVVTVSSSPGVGGAVDGEAAETLRIARDGGEPELVASSTARMQRVLAAEGGARMVASAAPEAVLQPEEIAQLVEFARALPSRYPELRDAEGAPAPADVEFGFVAGRLMLFQIRPFVQGRAGAAARRYLASLDADLERLRGSRIDLRQVPAEAVP